MSSLAWETNSGDDDWLSHVSLDLTKTKSHENAAQCSIGLEIGGLFKSPGISSFSNQKSYCIQAPTRRVSILSIMIMEILLCVTYGGCPGPPGSACIPF